MLVGGLETWTSTGHEVEPLRRERLDAVAWKDWDPAIIYSSEVRIMLNVYDTLVK